MFSAYDLKKIIPRAVFAIIAINLSWSVMGLMINSINTLGNGAKDLIEAPFNNLPVLSFSTAGAGSIMAIAVTAGAGAALGLLPIAGVAAAGLGGVLFAFLVVLARRVALLGLVILAPLGIGLMVFPQTEKWAKQWWEWFLKLLLMYPFIMAFFGLAQVAAGLLSRGNVVYQIAAIAVITMPYFLIGKALSLAGGTIGKFAGMINDPSKGLVDKTKKWDQQRVTKNRTDAAVGGRYDKDSIPGRIINRPLRGLMNAPRTAAGGLSHPISRDKRSAARAAAQTTQLDALTAQYLKDRPQLEQLTKDEALLLGSGSEKKAQDIIDAETDQARKQQLRVALESAKAKSGGFNTVTTRIGLAKAAESGQVSLDQARDMAADTAQSSSRQTRVASALTDHAMAPVKKAFQESGRPMQAELMDTASSEVAELFSSGGDPTQVTVALGGLSPGDQKIVQDQVGALFTKGSQEQLGKLDKSEREVVVQTKLTQASKALADATAAPAGSTDRAKALDELAQHRADILSLAQASTDQKNTEGVEATRDLSSQVEALLSAASAAGTISTAEKTALDDSSTKIFQDRFGSPGNRTTP